MKRKMMRKILIMCTLITLLAQTYSIQTYAITHEELRQWALENGGVRGGGGTHTEVSICPGQITPNSNGSTETTNTPTETKPVEVPKQPVHEHSYIETVTTEPTCIEEGVKTFTCSCGDKYTEPIEVVTHDYSKEIITQEPTCTENGEEVVSCTRCVLMPRFLLYQAFLHILYNSLLLRHFLCK